VTVTRRQAVLASGAVLAASGVIGRGFAAQRARPFTIGALTISWGPTPAIAGLRDGLKALGYREDYDFVIGVRFTQGNAAELPAAARSLVQSGVDIIVTSSGGNATTAAQSATQQIPIVFLGESDPVGRKLIISLARPGGNITGVSNLKPSSRQRKWRFSRSLCPA